MSALHWRKLARNATSTAAMRVIVAGVSFLCFVLIARRWDTLELGRFATLYTFFIGLQQVPLLGLHLPVVRELAKRPGSLAEIGPSVAVIALGAAAVLAVAVGAGVARAYDAEMQAAFWFVGASLVPGALIVLAESVLTAQERLARAAALSIVENLTRTLLWLGLVMAGYGLTALFACLFLVRVLTLAAYYGPRDLRPVLHLRRFETRVAAGWLALTPTFLGILVLAVCINRLDFVMLSQLATFEQVGLYAAPYKIYEVALMAPSVLALALFPHFSAIAARGDLERLTRQIVRVCLTAGLPCGVVLAFLAQPLTVWLFGPNFAPAGVVLAVLALVPVVVAVNQALTMALLATGRERLDLVVLVVATVAYLCLLAALIPLLGILGAALATAATAVVQLLIRHALVRTYLGLGNMTEIAMRPVLAAVAMGGTMWSLRPLSPALALAAGIVVYLAALALVKAVTHADVVWVRGALRRTEEVS